MQKLTRVIAAICLAVCVMITNARAEPFLRDGDRVVLLGNTMIEREQQFGWWEWNLTVGHPEYDLQFRNLGWSGDTVWAESRGLFDPPAKGYHRMLELVRELKPTVIILGYGNVEAFSGPTELSKFSEQYRKLRNDLVSTGARFVHLSPLLIEVASLPPSSRDSAAFADGYNTTVAEYSQAIRQIAQDSGDRFIDLTAFQRRQWGNDWAGTQNGLHLSDDGYRQTGAYLAQQLGVSKPETGSLQDAPAAELRSLIITKNRLFFHRWRPQNFTYLFGFRKHEQGQNATEVAQFDPLVAGAEKEIASLRARFRSR